MRDTWRGKDNMEQEFTIENGVLIKYDGPGGSVTIPEGVTKIGERAFICRTDLTGILLPEGVTKIDVMAFHGCTHLTEVTIPEGAIEISAMAFSNCDNLRRVVLPQSLRRIGGSAFDSAPLAEVTIPEGVTKIGSYAFSDCRELTEIRIPNSVRQIERNVFAGCREASAPVIVPEGVETIKESAFRDCARLPEAILPKSLLSIGPQAFSNCRSLRRIVLLGEHTIPAVKTEDPFEGADAPIIAPDLPLGDMPPFWKPRAVWGFALERDRYFEEHQGRYLRYIRSQRKRLFPLAVRRQELLLLMFEEQMIPRKDIQLLLDEADRQGNAAARSIVLARQP